MKNIRKLIVFLTIIFISGIASAADYSMTAPMTISYTSNPAEDFLFVDGSAGAVGAVRSCALGQFGAFSCSADRINYATSITGAIEVPGTNTMIFSNAGGDIGLVNQLNTVAYNALGVTPSWHGTGAATNPMYKLTTSTASALPRKFAVDSSQNVYYADGLVIKKLIAPAYDPQTFYTLVSGVDFTPAIYSSSTTVQVIGLVVDNSNNLHVLVSTTGTKAGGGDTTTGYVSMTVISSAGSAIKHDLSLSSDSTAVAFSSAGIEYGGLVLDNINPNQNYTYAYYKKAANTGHIIHNSSSGTVDVGGGALSGITGISDINYKNFVIYLASSGQNLVRTYATNFEGYGITTGAPANPNGITGTFSWLNGLGASITTITPGQALSYKATISNESLTQYSFYTGWGLDSATMPDQLHELTNLAGFGRPIITIFTTNSNTLAGSSIYGYLLAKNNTDGTWSQLAIPTKLIISPPLAGFDSITLNKFFYNLTGDTVTATFTYKDGFPWIYAWNICSRADCSGGDVFQLAALPFISSSSFVTTGYPQGNYFAVMTKGLPFLQPSIAASQMFNIRPPVIGVSWDKTSYNLLPSSVSSFCLDSTPTTSYFSNITGYNGLTYGVFSCAGIPAVANANNSVMRASFTSMFAGTFYLNNSLGSIWNGTLNNGSASLVYVLTNTSPTEQWTLTGINASGETFSASTTVKSSDITGFSLNIDKAVAYNGDTLTITYTRPIYQILGDIILVDAENNLLATCKGSDGACQYYIDPAKQYVYGTWSAMWSLMGVPFDSSLYSGVRDIVVVHNAGRPNVAVNTNPGGVVPGEGWGVKTDENSKSHTIDLMDGYVGTMGQGVNNDTRFLFAVFIIVLFIIGGALATKGNMMVALICGFLPFAYFAMISLDPSAISAGIEYMPKWTVIVFILLLALALKILR